MLSSARCQVTVLRVDSSSPQPPSEKGGLSLPLADEDLSSDVRSLPRVTWLLRGGTGP